MSEMFLKHVPFNHLQNARNLMESSLIRRALRDILCARVGRALEGAAQRDWCGRTSRKCAALQVRCSEKYDVYRTVDLLVL